MSTGSLVTGVVNGQKYTVPEPVPVASDLLVGCYYFPGYFNARRWEPIARFGHPFPLLGFYRDSEPEIAAWHIKWAVEHGIDFFAFDWYCDYKTGHVRNHNAALEQGFLNARYREQLRFCIFWCTRKDQTNPTARPTWCRTIHLTKNP